MEIESPFSFYARWDSAGISCTLCKYASANGWPDLDRSFACRKHNVPLRAELDTRNYVLGEWFCKDFENDGRAHAKPLAEFETIKHSLVADILYRVDPDKNLLVQTPFSELSKFK